MPIQPHRPSALIRKVFRARDVIDRGLITRGQLRSTAWRMLRRGVYADSSLTVDHGVRCAAALLAAPDVAVVSGLSAAWILGVDLVSDNDPVRLTVPPRHWYKGGDGIAVRRQQIDAEEIQRWGPVRHTTAERTAWDLARGRDLVEAVVALDAMAGKRLVSREQLLVRSNGTITRAIELMDGRAESPPESRVRVHLILAGLPAPTPQFEVFHNGRWVARVDLAWPDARVAVEYDGEWHNDRDQFRKDRRRLNALTKSGWKVIFVTADTLRNVPALVDDIRKFL